MEMPISGPEGKSYITKYLLDCKTKMIRDLELNSYTKSFGEGLRNKINIPKDRLNFYKSNSKEIVDLIELGCDAEENNKSNLDNYPKAEKNISLVNEFYKALSAGDGVKANSFIVPEKRNKGNFQEDKINSFYGNMKQKLKVLEIEELDSTTLKVTFEYIVNKSKCNGLSTVKIKEVTPGIHYIEKISSNC